MMKDSNSPRRVYTRNQVVHVCYGGKTYAPPGETDIKVGAQVKVEIDEETKEAHVKWARPKKAVINETWKARKVPLHPRA